MAKETKTNAMRFLEQKKIPYEMKSYECDEFIDGITVAEKLGQDPAYTFKTLVARGKSGNYYCFLLPVAEELDLKKAAKSVGEKSVELLHVKDINTVTGYVRGGCTPIGMKKQFKTVIHSSCLEQKEIIVSGGALGVQLFLTSQDFLLAANARAEDIIFD